MIKSKPIVVLALIVCISIAASSSLFAKVDQNLNCTQIEAIVDSIFEYHLEEALDTRQITPYLYQQVVNQNCNSKAKLLTLAGIIYYNEGQYIKSKDMLVQSDSIFLEIGCQSNVCVFTKLIRGLIEKQEKNYTRAIQLFKRAGELSREFNFYSGLIQSNINQALVYNETNEFQKAQDFLFRAEEFIDKCENKDIPGYVYLNLGHSYLGEAKYDLAEAYFLKAKEFWSKNGFSKGLFYLENNYAVLAQLRGLQSDYEQHLKNALSIMENDSITNSSMSYLRLGYFYIDQNKEDLALEYLQKAMKVNDGHDDTEFLNLTTELLNLYGQRKNKGKIKEVSHEIMNLYQAKLNRLSKQESNWDSKEFILESKIIENEKLKVEQEEIAARVRSQRILLLLLGSMLLLSGVLIFVWFKSRNLKEQLRLEQLRTKISKDLHDDVGTVLAGISFQAELLENTLEDKQKNIAFNIHQQSIEANNAMKDMIWAIDARKKSSMDLEFKMKDYLASAINDKGINFSFENKISETVSDLSAEIKHNVYLIFKESIYNVLKHSDADLLTIQLSKDNNKLVLHISDNGSEQEIKKSGQGLLNMSERANALCGDFKFYYNKGYQTHLSIPLF